jgi:cysteine-rich repeat protein
MPDLEDPNRLSHCAKWICGNGVSQLGEVCDDGNNVDGDGCTSHCTVEPGYDCPKDGARCVFVCGNGDRAAGIKGCDDGNLLAGDGCSPTCTIEPGWICPVGKPCVRVICGDGIRMGNEECDDGNAVNGDGCSGCKEDDECIPYRGRTALPSF